MMRLPLPAGNLAIKAFLQGIAHRGVCQYIQRCKPPLPPQSDLAAHSLFSLLHGPSCTCLGARGSQTATVYAAST